jgi:hypothetical protein
VADFKESRASPGLQIGVMRLDIETRTPTCVVYRETELRLCDVPDACATASTMREWSMELEWWASLPPLSSRPLPLRRASDAICNRQGIERSSDLTDRATWE